MFILTTIMTLLAVGMAYWLIKQHRPESLPLKRAGRVLPSVGVQIICGDCCGDDESPRKTYMDLNGNCSACGGSSYMLAAERVKYARQLVAERRASSMSSPARILRFESRISLDKALKDPASSEAALEVQQMAV